MTDHTKKQKEEMAEDISWYENRIMIGDSIELLKTLPDNSVDCCVTSPPYFGLRDYGNFPNQIGHENTVDEYVRRLVAIFKEVRRVLKDSGTLWVNIGDSYCGSSKNRDSNGKSTATGKQASNKGSCEGILYKAQDKQYKQKELFGVPWGLPLLYRLTAGI